MRRPMTVREFAAVLEWEEEDTYHLVRAMIAAGAAKERGQRAPDGPGRGPNVYSLTDDFAAKMTAAVKRLGRA